MPHPDLEGGNPMPDGHRNQRLSTRNRPLRPLRGESDDSDSSWTLYSMYSNIAEKEDAEMVERCQKDKDGTLVFSGLFSATVGALLTLSFPELKPNSQDTSVFYLENIYQLQVFGNPNVSHLSIPSALAKPPAFSPPRYSIWVNSLWFLSLIVSLSGALMATLYRNWAVQYISVTQPPWVTLAKRARIRAIFAKGNPGPYTLWGTSREPDYLHFSLLLFIVGGLIYLFNINRAVFYAVVWWVGYMTISYTVYTVDVFDEPHALFHTPLSWLGLKIYLSIAYVAFYVCSCIPPLHDLRDDIKRHHHNLSDCYSDGILIGKRNQIEEIVFKPSSETDTLILERILLTLDEDPALETFFDAIPGFCNSKLSILPLSSRVQTKLRRVLDGFLNRTLSSNLVSESARASRLITCLNAAHVALGASGVWEILNNIFNGHWDEALQSVEIGLALRLWGHRRDYDLKVKQIVACIIARTRQCDDRWTMLVKEEFGVPDDVLQDVTCGDSVLLFILIQVSRQANHAGSRTSGMLSSLSKIDIHNTLPSLQRDFCTLWNEISQEARNQDNQGSSSTSSSRVSSTSSNRVSSTSSSGSSCTLSVKILRDIRHIYIALHQGTDAVPTAFSASTDSFDPVLEQPSSYPLCDIASHHPDSTTHVPIAISGSGAIPPTQSGDSPDASHQPTLGGLRLAEETDIFTGLPSPLDPPTTGEIGETAQVPTATFPVHSSSPSLDNSLQSGVATAQPDTILVSELSRPLESNEQQGPSTPYVAPLADISGILPTVPTSALVSTSPTPVLDQSSGTYETGPAFISKSSLPASSGGISAPGSPGSPPPPHVPPLLNPEPLSLLGCMKPDRPSDSATLLPSHPRKLGNDENMSLASTVLQSLVYCSPFRDLFRDLSVGQCERGGIGGCATPLVDATVRFLDGFAYKEKLSVTHQVARGKVRDDEDGKREDDGVHSFLSTDVLNALKEKRQFTSVRDDWQQDAAVFLGLYLEALDEELVTLQSSTSTHKLASTLKVEEIEEETQSGEGQTEMIERDYTSPISRIFGGRSRSTVRAPNRPDTTAVQDWRLLQLNIQSDSVQTVEDALTHISHPQPASQPVQVGQLSSSEESQQVQIEALPPVLVLHFKRFLYDATADSTVKISKPVKFAPELEIPLEIMAPVAGKSVEPAYYKLYGVLYHHGESASDGRYTVDVLRPNGDSGSEEGWLHIGEEGASVVRHEDVFEGHDNKQVDSKCAYMLIYCRAAPNQI